MTKRVEKLLSVLKKREYRNARVSYHWDIPGFNDLNEYEQSTVFLTSMLQRQQPVLWEDEIFGFNRYLIDRPGTNKVSHTILDGKTFYERYSNITPQYTLLIDRGFADVIALLDRALATAAGEERLFCDAAKRQLTSIQAIADQYRDHAKAKGCMPLYNALCHVPDGKPNGLYEALVFLKLLIFSLRCGHYKHITLGRFDQYMYPYYLQSKAEGMSDEAVLELIEMFFISLNVDSDLYPGIQQGDNGQSMVLGGYGLDGTSMYNPLTELCLHASLELSLIDPKINLRVNKSTPDHIYELGTKLTRQGLGFPQYLNDDVIVPGLIRLGYAPEDAANYTVAACWEPIIPGLGADIPNETAFSYPKVLADAIDSLEVCEDLPTLLQAFDDAARKRCDAIVRSRSTAETYYFNRPLPVSPLVSLMMHGCLEAKRDIGRFGAKYYNCGAFGAGLATATDSISAIEQIIFVEKHCDWATLKTALAGNFEGFEGLRTKLMQCAKLGGEDDAPIKKARALMQIYFSNLDSRPNGVGGVWRCGTGSAQNYIYDAADCPATANGRYAGQPYECSFSPALGAKVSGPLSVIRSFTGLDTKNAINGGPLTMELHHNVFRNPEGEKKVAQLIKLFVVNGGHQLQLNMLDRNTLLDALAHPEEHRDLVVRVWGWSGYFCELDPIFQDHILSRTQYSI